MRIKKVRLTTLSEAVRTFLARVRNGRGLLVEDEKGRAVAQVLPADGQEEDAFVEASPKEREAAFKAIKKIQRKVGKSMKAQGVTEEDLIREVLKDD